jgi:hypothetical protein
VLSTIVFVGFIPIFLKVHFMIESTAAAMAYGLLVAGRKRAMVVDIGGGTTDITVLQIDDTRYDMIYTGGHSKLGGQDFDQKLLRLIQDKLLLALKRKNIDSTFDELNTTAAKRVLLVHSRLCKVRICCALLFFVHFCLSLCFKSSAFLCLLCVCMRECSCRISFA